MNVGFIGWRGMVGSVLRQRMTQEGDWDGLDPTFFSTSSPGAPGPDEGGNAPLGDAHDLDALQALDVLVTCQGGAWTQQVHPELRQRGWRGTWIDAASALRMDDDAVLILDPVNGDAIRRARQAGAATFVGANCTVSLFLMGLTGLLRSGHVQWVSTMSYQAASGAGAANLAELVAQMKFVGDAAGDVLDGPPLTLDARVSEALRSPDLPLDAFRAPLAASVHPWIDRAVAGGQTREEWKGMVEANKLLGRSSDPLLIDGVCVRVPTLRCHAQAVTIKLDAELPLDEIEQRIAEAHPWAEVVPNDVESTLARLTPAAVSGTLQVPVGRLRKMTLGPTFLTAFTVGDQLLWGAAEPLRRMLAILRED